MSVADLDGNLLLDAQLDPNTCYLSRCGFVYHACVRKSESVIMFVSMPHTITELCAVLLGMTARILITVENCILVLIILCTCAT